MSVLLLSYQDENRINYSNCKHGGGGPLGLGEREFTGGELVRRGPHVQGTRSLGKQKGRMETGAKDFSGPQSDADRLVP